MSDSDFSISGRDFKLRKIDAIKQFHIMRRIAPILADMLPAMKDLQGLAKPGSAGSEAEKLDQIAKFVTPIMMGLSKLSDQDSEHVLFGLLNSVEVKQASGNWAKIVSGTMIMMQDLELPFLMQIAGRAFMFNLSGFFAALPQHL